MGGSQMNKFEQVGGEAGGGRSPQVKKFEQSHSSHMRLPTIFAIL